MRKTSLLLVFLFVLFFPRVSFARVIISEIAWMGTASSQFAEWIELFNDSDTLVDLSGAVLYEGGGSTPIITLTKTIGAHEYYLVERTTASSPDAVPGFNDDAGSFGGGGLSNSGESLVLKGRDGAVLDQLDAASGWPAGDSSTKETMQWSGSGWVTAAPTPRAVVLSGAATTQSSASSGSSFSSSGSSHAGTAGLAPILKPHESLSVQAGRDRIGFVGVPLLFEAHAFLGDASVKDPAFSWTFGDGASVTGREVEHAYQFPGEYVVVLNGTRGEDKSTTRLAVKIISPSLSITQIDTGNRPFIEIENTGGGEVNLWRASLRAGVAHFEFPEDTIIPAGGHVVFAKEITGLHPEGGDEVILMWPGGRVGAALTIPKNELVASSTIELERRVAELKQKIAEASRPVSPTKAALVSVASKVAVSATPVQVPLTIRSFASSTAFASSGPKVIVEIPKSKGGIFSWPGRALSFVGEFIFGN